MQRKRSAVVLQRSCGDWTGHYWVRLKPEVTGKWHEKMVQQDCPFMPEFPSWALRTTDYCCVLYMHHYAWSHEGWPRELAWVILNRLCELLTLQRRITKEFDIHCLQLQTLTRFIEHQGYCQVLMWASSGLRGILQGPTQNLLHANSAEKPAEIWS